jgi:hypothetical protein
MRIYRSDGLLDSSVKVKEAGMFLVRRLVEGVIPSDPCVVFVTLKSVKSYDSLTFTICSQRFTARS